MTSQVSRKQITLHCIIGTANSKCTVLGGQGNGVGQQADSVGNHFGWITEIRFFLRARKISAPGIGTFSAVNVRPLRRDS